MVLLLRVVKGYQDLIPTRVCFWFLLICVANCLLFYDIIAMFIVVEMFPVLMRMQSF